MIYVGVCVCACACDLIKMEWNEMKHFNWADKFSPLVHASPNRPIIIYLIWHENHEQIKKESHSIRSTCATFITLGWYIISVNFRALHISKIPYSLNSHHHFHGMTNYCAELIELECWKKKTSSEKWKKEREWERESQKAFDKRFYA